eukprot:12231819-Ditylum_brightwellii.AAC.1
MGKHSYYWHDWNLNALERIGPCDKKLCNEKKDYHTFAKDNSNLSKLNHLFNELKLDVINHHYQSEHIPLLEAKTKEEEVEGEGDDDDDE